MNTHKEILVLDNKGSVNLDQVIVKKSQEGIMWTSQVDSDVTITFKPNASSAASVRSCSPFAADTFTLPARGHVCTGVSRSDAQTQSYKYTLHGTGGITDPVIVVEPIDGGDGGGGD